jgi:hypothetical protein
VGSDGAGVAALDAQAAAAAAVSSIAGARGGCSTGGSFRVCSRKASFGIHLDTKSRRLAALLRTVSHSPLDEAASSPSERCGAAPPAGRRARMAQTFPTAWSSNPVSIHRPDPPKPRFQRLSYNLAILQGTRGSPMADPASRASSSCR